MAVAIALLVAGTADRLWPVVQSAGIRSYLIAAIAAGVVAVLVRGRPSPDEPNIHDRQVDYLVGLPLLGASLFVVTALPGRFGPQFWTSYAGLICVPLFLAGALALVFGTRALWRLRLTLTLLTIVFLPISDPVITAINEALRRPFLAGVRAAGGGDSIAYFESALSGLAGPLAFLVVVVLLTATASRRAEAIRRFAWLSGLGLAVLVTRLGGGLVAASYGPEAVHAVLGPLNDLYAFLVFLAATSVQIVLAERQGRRPAVGVVRGRPVGRARVALVIVTATAVAVAWLGLSTDRRSDLLSGAETTAETWSAR
ncbi:hypothetical protein [Cryptosporangium phraense]|uniref:Exosortase/archaeosortase family protein n=1 Tax=Cryptosporangium phraense TaxID=2593070 RepID=A0A545AG91_9ACTN|nr:hypothetical protein [Cryptosporangium phraense]TQS40311.1 hypothetical protein FL583_35435 [Cryptosporangium phraense]